MLNLPQGYLSPAQISMWESDRPKYIRKYMERKDENFSTRYTDYGNKVGIALETDEDTDEDLINLAKDIVPRYKEREKVLEAIVETEDVWFVLMGKLDTFEDDPVPRLREFKTGRPKWTQARAENLGQVMHYISMVYLIYKRMPEEVHLDWLETEIVNETLQLSGHYEAFVIKKSLKDVLVYLAKATKIAKEIDEVYAQFLSGKIIN